VLFESFYESIAVAVLALENPNITTGACEADEERSEIPLDDFAGNRIFA